MAQSYFTLPMFARAKKNKEDLEKQNPQNPLLKDEDEKFLEKQISNDDSSPTTAKADQTVVFDNGKEVKSTSAEDDDQLVAPALPPRPKPSTTAEQPKDVENASKVGLESDEKVDETKKQGKQAAKPNDIELPSQEEAEAATRANFDPKIPDSGDKSPHQGDGEKRTWASYIPSVPSMTSSISSLTARKEKSSAQDTTTTTTTSKDEKSKSDPQSPTSDQRTWAQYASSYVPTIPFLSKDKDAESSPVLNEDGSVNEEATAAKQEREVSVLLDTLNLSAINNRVFAFSAETQKIYDRFAQVLKDTMNGAPTAYQDMDKLMRDAGPTLERQYKNLPPFVQTLIKSLPAKLAPGLAPELLAMAGSTKPDADLKLKSRSLATSSTSTPSTAEKKATKSKRRIPSLKSLIGKQGAVATILRNVVSFLRVRFPLLASGTNVVMSLAVFILMFVFWYCHKRGKETRLERESSSAADGTLEEIDDDEDVDASDDEDDDGLPLEDEKARERAAAAQSLRDKEDVLGLAAPAEVPLPEEKAE